MRKLYIGFVFVLVMVLSFGTFTKQKVSAASPIGTTFNFYLETVVGLDAPVYTDLGVKTYGSAVTIDAGTYNPENEFVTYIVNNKIESDLPELHTFIVTGDLEVTAIYKPAGTIAVAFMDSNQDILKVEYVESAASATPPDISELTKPGYVPSATEPWSGSYTAVTEDTVVWVQYELSSSEPYTISVVNGTADKASYQLDEVATVTANGTGNFQYWEQFGQILSFNPVYSFTVADPLRELTAIYDDTLPSPNADILFISMSFQNVFSGFGLTTIFVGQFNIPDGNTLIEYGFIQSSLDGAITFDTPDITKIRSNHYNPITNEYVRVTEDWENNYRAYMITTDGMVETITYSNMPIYEDLIFSEYGESGSYKYLELYNTGTELIDLTDYTIKLYANENTNPTNTLELTGTLSPGETLTVTGESVTNFNGNDAVVLFHHSYIVDIIGEIGSGAYFAEDVTLTRKSNVLTGTTTYDPNEWDSMPFNDAGLGTHAAVYVAPISLTITGSDNVMAGATIALDVTYDPTTATKGVNWYSDNETIATVDSDGVVTGVAEGTATIYALGTYNHSIFTTYTITVTPAIYYSVTYEENGGTAVTDETNILSGTYATEPTDPTLLDYTFDGWYLDDGTFAEPFDFAEDPIITNITLYAKWLENFTVTFDSNEGTAVSPEEVANGKFATEPTDPTLADHTFNGWFTDDVTFTNPFDFEADAITTDITLYAKWLENFTVTYDSNEGTAVNPEEVANGKFATEPADPTKVDKVFDGWYTDNDTFAQPFDFTTDDITADITLYAKWIDPVAGAEYTYTYDSAGKYTSGIADGLIPAERIVTTNDGAADITAEFYKNDATTTTIFNNSAGETRLYKDSNASGNGGQLTFSVEAGYVITSIIINTDGNNGFSINGSGSYTGGSNTIDFGTGVSSVVILNISTATLEIEDITIIYEASE